MILLALRLGIGVFATAVGLIQLILIGLELGWRIRARRLQAPGTPLPLLTPLIRENLARGAISFTVGIGLDLGGPYIGYAALLVAPLFLVRFFLDQRRLWSWLRDRSSGSV